MTIELVKHENGEGEFTLWSDSPKHKEIFNLLVPNDEIDKFIKDNEDVLRIVITDFDAPQIARYLAFDDDGIEQKDRPVAEVTLD